MTDKPENPPAFPTDRPLLMVQNGSDKPAEIVPGSKYLQGGLTMRDYFAAAALQGIRPEFRSCNGTVIAQEQDALAKYCYEIADAMLIERAKS